MTILAGNKQLRSARGEELTLLTHINALSGTEKRTIYASLIPERLLCLLGIPTACMTDERISVIAPEGLNLARIEVRQLPEDPHTVFFLDIAGTQFNQMELSFCIINDPAAPRYDVDVDEKGTDNCFCSLGRNIPEEIRAMNAGLYPNQTSRGLRLFGEFFEGFERFVDSLGMEMITAEPLTYDNAIRYERFGFDYLSGRRMMLEIDKEFKPGGMLHRKLDGSTPFRQPGADKSVRGRSWAIHDGILDEPWDDLTINEILDAPWEDVKIYRMVGRPANVCTFAE